MLAPGEAARVASKRFRDAIVFTDRRIIFVDKQGLTGGKVESPKVARRAIASFSV